MQQLLVAFMGVALASGTRTAPHQGKIDTSENQTTPVLLRSAYDRLIKAAAQVEKITGDASLLSKGKRSKAAERALVEDPKMIMSDAAQLVDKAYAVLGTKPPSPKPDEELKVAWHEILLAAAGVEDVRRHADTLPAQKIAAFVAEVKSDPEKIEEDVNKLEEDMKAAEEDVESAEKELKEAKAAEDKADDKEASTEAAAANKAAKQALAEADHEQDGGHELVGKAEGDKKKEEVAAADKAKSEEKVAAATEEHKAADAAHAEADKVDDAHEDKVDEAEEKVEDAKEEHVEAIEEHNGHPEAKDAKNPHDGASQLAFSAVFLTLAMFL